MNASAPLPITDLTDGKQYTPEVMNGQAVYTKDFLEYFYDFMVHRVTNHLTWDCPTRNLVDLYNRHATPNHLDVGPGTGYLLERCRFGGARPRLALMDLNVNALHSAAQRVRRSSDLSLYRANILEPIPALPDERRFDSIGLAYVLHCLPGKLEEKGIALGHLKPLLAPGGVLLGATILNDRYAKTHFRARAASSRLRAMGVFDNHHDTQAGLDQALRTHFTDYTIETIGTVALFTARAS